MVLLTLNLTSLDPAAAIATAAQAAVKLRLFLRGPQAVVITAGEDDLALLIPSDEPISVGPPPIAPALIEELSLSDDAGGGVRTVPDSAGYIVSMPLAGGYRPRFSVRWQGLTFSERNLVLEFLRGVDFTSQVAGGRSAFDVELDGPGSGVTKVRPVEPFSDTWETKTAYTIEVKVEEIL